MQMKNMAHDISLDHLKDDELAMILKVLERDAQIQKHEDARRQKLRDSIKFERIPGKRLSVKLRTGDWMNEIAHPLRQKEKRGSDIVRASIRQKKWKKEEAAPEKVDEGADNDRQHPSKPDVVIEADKLNLKTTKSPARKPSIRRKQVKKTAGKQVTFNDDKTEKLLFNDPATQAEELDQSDKRVTGSDANEGQYTEIQVAVVPDDRASQGQVLHAATAPESDTKFESYHNSFALVTPARNSNEQQDDKSDKEKMTKKVRVIKRKGSSRRKLVGKITDDSDRDNLFRAFEQKEVKDPSEEMLSNPMPVEPDVVVKESAMTYSSNPYELPTAAVSDYSIDDNCLKLEEVISVIRFEPTLGYAPSKILEVAKTEPNEDLSTQDDASDLTADGRTASIDPQGGCHDIRDRYNDNDISKQNQNHEPTAAASIQDCDHENSSTPTPDLPDIPAISSDADTASLNVLGIAQDYADATLKPTDFSKMLQSDAMGNTLDFDTDEDGGRTPIIANTQALDGMELLKEIEAVLPQVTNDSATGDYPNDQETESNNATQRDVQLDMAKDTPDGEIQPDIASKPKKRVVKVITKSKRKSDEKTASPDHNSQPDVDADVRMLIDEASKNLNDLEPKDFNQAAGRKKIVKKIVKKKKADDSNADDDQHESPQKADANPDDDAKVEEYGLARRKTVRRKVSKRQPPPPPSQLE